MERSKLKDIVRSLELMVDALKVEVYSDVDSYKDDTPPKSRLDYDESVSYTHLTLPTKVRV